MAKQLQVLFLSSEVEPFAKTGGLADVSGALPKAIKSLDHEVRVMMPRYGFIKDTKAKLHDMIRLRDIPVPVGPETYTVDVKSSFLSNTHTKVQVYFLYNQELFKRNGLYVNPDTKKDYPDNDTRFIFFARGILEVLKKMGWQPDIIHCNDWQTGLVPAYLKTIYRGDPFFKDMRTVFTIHNMAYQGIFPAASFAKTGLPEEAKSEDGVLAHGKLNLLKAGLIYSDAITTVSKKYSEEIRTTDEFGCGLQHILAKRKKDLTGLLNGIDNEVWNPAVDDKIPHKYDIRSIDLKVENKKALLAKAKIGFDEKTPLIGIISRLADQKGFDLIGEIIDDILKLDVQLIVLGLGEKKYQDMLEKGAKKYSNKMAFFSSFNEELAHWIEAGSDIFLMPSRYEPCGLNQMYSLKYGTVPIVRATGGLDDTIEAVNPKNGSGTGFKFSNYTSRELLKTIQQALKLYADQDVWRKIVKNGMGKDFSWESSAKDYLQLYRSVAKK